MNESAMAHVQLRTQIGLSGAEQRPIQGLGYLPTAAPTPVFQQLFTEVAQAAEAAQAAADDLEARVGGLLGYEPKTPITNLAKETSSPPTAIADQMRWHLQTIRYALNRIQHQIERL